MSRCVIIGGADIHRYDRIKASLHADDYFIYCDSGLKHMETLGAMVQDICCGNAKRYFNL